MPAVQPDFEFVKEWALIHKIDIEQAMKTLCLTKKVRIRKKLMV
jgi:hypothetical protein